MTVSISSEGRGTLTIDIEGHAATAIGEVLNPEGVNIQILRATLVVLTPSTGAANLTAGIGISGSANTDVLAAEAMALGAGVPAVYNCFAMQNTADTAITAPALWTPTLYLTITGSATTVGLTAKMFVEYIRVD